jgi:SAM-dependent methyltransferase
LAAVAVSIADAWPDVGDSCGKFFGTCLKAFRPDLRADASVLEIGCCEFDWLKHASQAWPAMTLTGIDWRTYKRKERYEVIKGDVMTHDFQPASFDWIVSVSAIEHIGLGHYEKDPKRDDGDTRAITRAWDWLKPGGWLSFDVPYNPERYEVVGTSHRIYDDDAIHERLVHGLPWRMAWSGIAAPKDTHALIPPRPRRGGEEFDYIGFWWQKPGV